MAEPTDLAVEYRFELGPRVPVPPPGDPGDPSDLLRCWSRGDDHWIGVGEAVGMISGNNVTIGGPAETEDDLAALDILCQSMLAVAFAGPRRVVVHGAAVGRGSDVMLVVGPSGAGKSTTAAAALLTGWELLSDDLVVVDLDPARLTGVRRAPMFPDGLLAGSHFDEMALVVDDDSRGRTRLPADVLTASTRPLAGLVVVSHGTADGGLDVLEPGSLDIISGAALSAFHAPPVRGSRRGRRLADIPATPRRGRRSSSDAR